jgi:hypothetical protein
MNRVMGVPIIALALFPGCGRGTLRTDGGGGASGTGGAGATFQDGWIDQLGRNVDILFMVDNTAGRLVQANLERNFPTFVSTLERATGRLPSLHLAVITSDLGAGDGTIASCSATGGDAGRFQYTARGSCTATNLQPGATFISDMDGVRNFTGNLADVFTCIAATGNSGCGFEQPLASVVRALGADGRPAPPENQGFLRPEAFLLVVLLTDEDDCSVPGGSNLFDTTLNTTLASPLGPVSNFRCNEFGHLCNGFKPPRRGPTGSTADIVTMSNCISAEGAGMLTPVATFVQQLQALKPDPSMVMVAAIAGPTTPYEIHWKTPSIADPDGAWPAIANACAGADGSLADPAVRINQWVNAFGANGEAFSVCSDNFAPALQSIAEHLTQRLPPPENTP